jgi:alkylation response protein AidB-like acyl-CoA dehydrogenase
MDFTFNPEQDMLRDSLRKLLEQQYDFDTRQKIVNGPLGQADALWPEFTDMGLLALPLPENRGGFGGKPSDLVAIGELFGQFLVSAPYVGAVMLGAQVLALGGAAQAVLLERVLAGQAVVALAHEESHGVGRLEVLQTEVQEGSDGLVLSGEKRLVLAGSAADTLIVSARGAQGLMLVLVDPAAQGVKVTGYQTVDGRQAANIRFDQVTIASADVLPDADSDSLNRILDLTRLMLSAEAVGAMSALVQISAAYAATRKQFGQPIGNFQAIAHKLADMKIACTKAQAHLLNVTALADMGRAAPRDFALLKAQMGRLGRLVGETAIQLHGGIAMTDELNVGHYHKRILAIEAMLGNTEYQLRLAGAGG